MFKIVLSTVRVSFYQDKHMKIFTTIIIIKRKHLNSRIIKKNLTSEKKGGGETIFQ